MKGVEREPTTDELAAMAYVDGEMAKDQRTAFEDRLRREPRLALEVTALQRLHSVARAAAGPEPMDYEWERIARSPVHRAGTVIGWSLFVLGMLGLSAALVLVIIAAVLPWPVKALIGASIAGLAILFVLTLRARLRTLPYDAYTEVKR